MGRPADQAVAGLDGLRRVDDQVEDRLSQLRGIAEEAPLAYKDVDAVVDVADRSGLARKVARLDPLVCIKG